MEGDAQLDSKAYLEERVEGQLAYYEKASGRAKRTYVGFQGSIILLAVVVPVLVNLQPIWGKMDFTLELRVLTTVMSLLLAVLSGLLSFRKYGELWLSYRATEELLKQEKYLFLARAGRYAGNQSAFEDFVSAIEGIVSGEHSKFTAMLEEARRPAQSTNQ